MRWNFSLPFPSSSLRNSLSLCSVLASHLKVSHALRLWNCSAFFKKYKNEKPVLFFLIERPVVAINKLGRSELAGGWSRRGVEEHRLETNKQWGMGLPCRITHVYTYIYTHIHTHTTSFLPPRQINDPPAILGHGILNCVGVHPNPPWISPLQVFFFFFPPDPESGGLFYFILFYFWFGKCQTGVQSRQGCEGTCDPRLTFHQGGE